jgi:hypothetical protein
VTDKPRTTDVEILRQCVDRIIESGALGRGHLNAKLLNYLADRAARAEVPKEFDISVDVFHKSTSSADIADAQTRVHIYKLRARLEAYYAGAGKSEAFRLEIPKGTYQLVATANDSVATTDSGTPRRGAWRLYAVSGLLAASLLLNILWLGGFPQETKPSVAHSAMWAALGDSGRPVLVVLGDHFFFGETGSHVRTRDIAINSDAELRSSPSYGAKPGLVFETLSYLPRSSMFALQTLLPGVAATPENVTLKLVSELTPEDLRTHDIVYVGFVRAMGILRDYYFTRSNFEPDEPLFLSLTESSSGEVFTRSGPVPQYNRDYGLFARLTGPAGNRIVVMAGIGDVGVSAVVRAMHSDGSDEQGAAVRAAAGIDAGDDFELLIEADGHSRTDLDSMVLRALPLRTPDASPVTGPESTTAPDDELRAGR